MAHKLLRDEDIRKIVQEYESGEETSASLARKWGVSQATMWRYLDKGHVIKHKPTQPLRMCTKEKNILKRILLKNGVKDPMPLLKEIDEHFDIKERPEEDDGFFTVQVGDG